jgi:hypothetical protein
MDTDILVPIFGIVFTFGSISYVAYVILEAVRARQHARLTSELQHKLLDRVGSSQELSALLNTEGGARLLATMSPGPTEGGPASRILRALQAGCVLLAVGVGLFLFAGARALPVDSETVVTMIATLATALGIGLLLATGASYALSQRLGLLDGRTADRGRADVT